MMMESRVWMVWVQMMMMMMESRVWMVWVQMTGPRQTIL